MKKMILGAFAAMALVACGGGDPCSAGNKCSADPAPTADQITACQAAIKDGAKCAAENKAYATCARDAQVCGSDNKTDGAATLTALASKCATQAAAVQTCLTK